ncbi:MAG: hypothetical protein E7G07_11695, partial [Flavonifractor plautii]|nr:hypothetical protein [Flavonifractor plautii]
RHLKTRCPLLRAFFMGGRSGRGRLEQNEASWHFRAPKVAKIEQKRKKTDGYLLQSFGKMV